MAVAVEERVPDARAPNAHVRTLRLFAGVALLVLAIYGFSSRGTPTIVDEQIILETTGALVHGRADIKPPYVNTLPGLSVLRNDGKRAGIYGIGTSAVAAPLYVSGKIVGWLSPAHTRTSVTNTATMFANGIIGAATTFVLMLLCRRLGASPGGAVLIGLSYALGSYAFPHALTLFTEPGTALFLLTAVYFAFRAESSASTSDLVLCGACAATALLFRVSAVLFLPLIGLWLVVIGFRPDGTTRRALRYGATYTAGAIGPIVLLLLVNWWRYHDPWNVGYTVDSATKQSYPILRGVAGQWLSSGKSIFLFAPITIIAVLGLVRSFRKMPYEIALLAAIVVVNTLFFARVQFWSGDWAWGPRYLQIVLPCIAATAAPLMDARVWRRALAVLSVLGLLFSALPAVLLRFAYVFPAALKVRPFTFGKFNWDHSHYALIWHSFRFQQIVYTLRLLPHALANTFGFGDPAVRPAVVNQAPHNARLEFWWLRPHDIGLFAWLLFMAVTVLLAYGGARLVRGAGLRSSSPDRVPSQAPASATT